MCKAHVFHIDPKTKRSWVPASSAAISVSFFYDSTRSLYRIISIEGTKVIERMTFSRMKMLRTHTFKSFLSLLQPVINSTITPNMTFTKTSQKFGQWSDVRANTVYGLGFASEAELGKVRKALAKVCKAEILRVTRSQRCCSLTVHREVPRGERGHEAGQCQAAVEQLFSHAGHQRERQPDYVPVGHAVVRAGSHRPAELVDDQLQRDVEQPECECQYDFRSEQCIFGKQQSFTW